MSSSKFNLYNQATRPDVMPVYSTVQSAPIEKKKKKVTKLPNAQSRAFPVGLSTCITPDLETKVI